MYIRVMVIDIILISFLIGFAVLGSRRGFLRSLLSLVSITVSILLAVLGARPIARLLDNWWGLADSIGEWFSGGGILDSVARNNGMLVLIIMVAVVLFVGLRISLFFLKRFVKHVMENSKVLGRIDQVLGLFFGIVRFFYYVCLLSLVVMILSSTSALADLPQWLFADSTIAAWLYDRALDVVIPLLRSVGAQAVVPS